MWFHRAQPSAGHASAAGLGVGSGRHRGEELALSGHGQKGNGD